MISGKAIELKNLCKKYKGFTLDSITLSLPTGCIMGLIGENGAGKSTLIKLILGNIIKSSGEIFLLGEDDERKFYNLRQSIGVVPDEVAFPENFKVKHIQKMLRFAFARWDDKVFDSYIDRFAIDRDKKFKDFSYGMKKKLGIAAALSHNAKLLIFDEATSGLDPIARDELTDILYDFTRSEEHSVLLFSHIVSDLEKLCDYIAAMHNGKLLFCEEKDILLDKYRMLRCSEEEIRQITNSDIIGKRISPYGVQAVVKKSAVPAGGDCGNITIEDLFVFMVKEGR